MRQLARQAEHRRQVHFDDVIPILVAHANEQAILGDAGVVDEDIDAFQLGFSLFTERFDFSAVGKVGRENLDAAISSPMPPVAPVTRALRPVRSNMSYSFFRASD